MSASPIVSERYGHEFDEDGDVVEIYDEEHGQAWIRSSCFTPIQEVA